MPRLAALRGRLTTQRTEVVAVCINGSSSRAEAEGRKRSPGLLVEAPGSRIAALYGVDRVPTTLVIDEGGKIVARWQGAREDLLRKGLGAAGITLQPDRPADSKAPARR